MFAVDLVDLAVVVFVVVVVVAAAAAFRVPSATAESAKPGGDSPAGSNFDDSMSQSQVSALDIHGLK